MRPPAPVRPPPLVRAGGGLPPMPRLRLGAPRHPQRMSPMQQNPLASMFNMLPPPHHQHGHAMVGLPPGAAPPRGFGPPPFTPRNPSHMSSMGPRIMRPPPPPPPSNYNGSSLTSSLRDIRPPSRLSQNKQRMTTSRMPNFNQPPQQQRNMMIPQDPLPAMISPKGPKGPKSATTNTMSNAPSSHRIKTVPTSTPPPLPVKPTNSSPSLIKPVQVPPPLNRR